MKKTHTIGIKGHRVVCMQYQREFCSGVFLRRAVVVCQVSRWGSSFCYQPMVSWLADTGVRDLTQGQGLREKPEGRSNQFASRERFPTGNR